MDIMASVARSMSPDLAESFGPIDCALNKGHTPLSSNYEGVNGIRARDPHLGTELILH